MTVAKKKTSDISKTKDILTTYMDYVLENDGPPKSMYQFAGILEIKESEVYKQYASFRAMEQSIFKQFFDHTIGLLKKDVAYKNFDARNKLLSFYFTFFEMLRENRSYVIHVLYGKKQLLESVQTLSLLRTSFKAFVDTLDFETMDLKKENLERMKKKGLNEMAWNQLMITMKYWLDDTSPGFEKTDLFIEKSLKASFDLINTRPLESLVDLGKFLFKDKFSMG